jgi:hypothetical protein
VRRLILPCLALSLATCASVTAQGLLPKTAVQHASVTATASAPSAAAGSTVTLFADVTPHPSIHIYAEGATDFTPVSLVITPTGAANAGKPVYPRPQTAASPGAVDVVPAYTKTFRISVPVTVKRTARPGDTLTIGGAVKYQACDDRLCYPVTAAPVTWTLSVK